MENIKVLLAAKGSYELTIGVGTDDGLPCYLLTNIETGVIEVETKVLPQAYQYLNDLDGGLKEAIMAYVESTTITPATNVTSIH